ncbi:MAG: TonB-dependent receptor plug domain-containing protein, partial [Anaerolineales bacterium]|nr:TonB-dependent receptor plug domain-containing protein [Anaerolineales bacterium]
MIGPDPSRPLRWKLDLPAIATACGASSGFIFSPGCRRDGALWRERPWTGKTGSVVFTVTRRDGRPAADALVLAYPTGDDADARDGDWSGFVRSDGRLRLDGVPIGTYTLRLDEAGLVASETPFEVVADKDVGYQAANTTSGSRLNSRLRDTPAAVAAFTPEFLADIAATNLEEMLGHATNIELDVEDANAGFNNPQGRGADGNDYQFRMRGSPAGASRDFVESSIPVDLYNVERAEVASGPNSILFGLGQAGGLVSLSGKKANLQRPRTTLKNMLGSWHYERYEGDHNQVLLPRRLSLRLVGMYQNNQGWRHWDFADSARWTAAVAYQPFKNTTVHVSYERGHMDNNLTLGWNAQDQISAWWDGGRQVFEGTAVPAGSGTNRFNANNQNFVFNQQDGIVYNYRGEFQSGNRYGVETLLPGSVSPYGFNLTGPGGVRHQTFNSRQITVQQRLPRNVNLELAYFRNLTDVEANGMAIAGANLRADPNHATRPVVIISGRSDAQVVGRLIALGITDYLVKPFALETVQQRLGG